MALTVSALNYVRGIGSASNLHDSGEILAVLKLMRLRKPVDVVFDVGASVGKFYQEISSSKSASEVTNYHLFEPSAKSFRILEERFGGIDRIVLNNCAISDRVGFAEIFSPADGSELTSLSQRDLRHVGLTFDCSMTVPLDTIDEYCKRNHVDKIDLLKIDVEGHELDVLHGSSELLKARSIDLILFEFGGANIDSRTYFRDIYFLLREQGFSISRVTPFGYLHEILEYSETDEIFSTTNYIAQLTR